MLIWNGNLYNPVARAPRNWERAVGYDGEARYVSFYWMPGGDEAMWDDGRISADGSWGVYLDLVDGIPVPAGCSLGSSDFEATHRLVLDRETRLLYIIPYEEASAFLQAQHPPLPEISPQDLDTFLREIAKMLREPPWASREIIICERCGFTGWVRAADGGYDACPECGGRGYLEGKN